MNRGQNALVLGLGETGLSMARFLARRGARVRVAIPATIRRDCRH